MIRPKRLWKSLICRVFGHVDPSPAPEFDGDIFRCSRCGSLQPTNGMTWREWYKTYEKVQVCFGEDAWGHDPYQWLPKNRDKSLDKMYCRPPITL